MTLLANELLAPIDGDNPAGADLRYEQIYIDLENARREDDGMPQGDWQTARKSGDWTRVVRLATDALTKQSKDLQIAAWLTEAWLRREGFSGLRRGLELVHELLNRYWEHVYPELDEGDTGLRARPLGWIGVSLDVPVRLAALDQEGHSLIAMRQSKTVPTREEADRNSSKAEERERAIKDGRVPPEDIERAFLTTTKAWFRALADDIEGSLRLLSTLDEFCRGRFEESPNFSDLRKALQEVQQMAAQLLARKLEMDPDPPAETLQEIAGAADAAEAGAEAAALSARAVKVAAGPRDRDEAAAWIAAAARALRQDRPADPAAYLMVRGFRWGELRSGGGRIDPRLLAAPPTDVRTRLKGMLLDAAWPQLLNAAEEVMVQPFGRGWLDLQRYVLTASDGMGTEYEAVGAAIRGALRTLLADLPELTAQTLMDDSPTANAETRNWLRDEKLLATTEDIDDEAPQELRSAMSRRDPYELAQARVRAGDPNSAMELLMRAANQEKSARARFLRRAQAADVMVGAGMEPVAMPILRELLALIETHRLEDWEAGDAVAQPLALLYRCARILDNNDVDTRSLYERICRLDPIRAVQLQTARSGHEGG